MKVISMKRSVKKAKSKLMNRAVKYTLTPHGLVEFLTFSLCTHNNRAIAKPSDLFQESLIIMKQSDLYLCTL